MNFNLWLNTRLRAYGAYDGVVDSVFGRASIEALKRFQVAEKLSVTGQADEATVEALRLEPRGTIVKVVPAPALPAEPIWMREARRFMGLTEIPGPKSNPTILGWAEALGGWIAGYYRNDDTAWCGLFMAHCVGAVLPQEKLPANPLGALEWNKFGSALSAPVPGAILVFSRTGGGHVGLYVGEDDANYVVLGGNQGNKVKLSLVEKSRCVGIRWPKTGGVPVGGRVRTTLAEEVSRNEA
jgi:uncharacterized protein (TIGR02594 family)